MAVQTDMNEALGKFQGYANELATFNGFREADYDTRFPYIRRVLQYYKYIVGNTVDSNVKQAADSILWGITTANPSTSKTIKFIYDTYNGVQTKTQNIPGVDPNKISRTIDSLVAEVRSMGNRGVDPDRLGEIEWSLQRMRGMLSESRSAFYSSEYQRLLEQSNTALKQIKSYKAAMESANKTFDSL